MIVISDTNILSSLAAAKALNLLFQLFNQTLYIPPAVKQELQTGLNRGRDHIELVMQAIDAEQIQILELSTTERRLLSSFPHSLNDGECEGIALSKTRGAQFLSNDRRAIRYCQDQNIHVLNLPDILRSFWIKGIATQDDVRTFIALMAEVEKLTLRESALDTIFAARSRPRRKKR